MKMFVYLNEIKFILCGVNVIGFENCCNRNIVYCGCFNEVIIMFTITPTVSNTIISLWLLIEEVAIPHRRGIKKYR